MVAIRPGTLDDLPFLREMLFEAAYWRPGQARPDLEVGLERPDLVYLLADWGRDDDAAVIAVTEAGEAVGAAWFRFWGPEQHSYGYVSPQIPELGIAVRADFRGQGIGHQLIRSILNLAASHGIEQVSLSVEIENLALNLYQQHGFEPVQKNPKDWVMVASLDNSPGSN